MEIIKILNWLFSYTNSLTLFGIKDLRLTASIKSLTSLLTKKMLKTGTGMVFNILLQVKKIKREYYWKLYSWEILRLVSLLMVLSKLLDLLISSRSWMKPLKITRDVVIKKSLKKCSSFSKEKSLTIKIILKSFWYESFNFLPSKFQKERSKVYSWEIYWIE